VIRPPLLVLGVKVFGVVELEGLGDLEPLAESVKELGSRGIELDVEVAFLST